MVDMMCVLYVYLNRARLYHHHIFLLNDRPRCDPWNSRLFIRSIGRRLRRRHGCRYYLFLFDVNVFKSAKCIGEN